MGCRGRSFPLSLMLIATLGFIGAFAQVRASAQNKPAAACLLTEAQTKKSIEAFDKIAGVLTGERRCLNCHGGVNPFIKGTGLDPEDKEAPASKSLHGGGLIVRQREKAPDGTALMEGECQDCHNHMARKRDGSPSRWTTAPGFLSFVNKDATTLCRQIKRSSGTAMNFLGHLRDDNGGNAFGETAFNGDRGLDPDRYDLIPPEKPSISHDELMKLGGDWVAAMGGSFKGDESCGCEFKHAGWSGQIHYTFDSTGDEGADQLQEWSGRTFKQITFTFKDGVGTAVSNAEVKSHGINRRGVVNNGKVTLILDNSGDTAGSVAGTSPATVKVDFYQGMYSIQPGWMNAVGKLQAISCVGPGSGRTEGCTQKELPFAVDMGAPIGLFGKVTDPNHVQGETTVKREGTGRSKKGVDITTVTWDLWRTS